VGTLRFLAAIRLMVKTACPISTSGPPGFAGIEKNNHFSSLYAYIKGIHKAQH
jgi:hypothetical protein